jgi:hypothetical protein
MATGGIFQLITNDGKQDRMLMASALLKGRIDDIKRTRLANGQEETPTLYDIERTHILFTNAHFKPFAAIGYEYNKVTSTGGNSLGGKVMFSIPQFGDFFNDMVVHAVITQPTLEHIVGGVPVEASKQNLMRWCAYPGERLLKNVKFEVNGNPLDEYTSDAVNYHREFGVQPNKKLAWDRCVGQEVDQDGYLDQPNWVGSGVPASDITYRSQVAGNAGLQTPTGQKVGDVELFIPLLFWCNKDPRLAVPSVAIPYGQRFISMELATNGEMCGLVARGFTTGDSSTLANVTAGGTLNYTSMGLKDLELYINNIFVNPEVHNIFIKRIGFTLIRVHRRQSSMTGGGTESLLLQNLKWPIESLCVGMRVKSYSSLDTPDGIRRGLDKWHTFSTVTHDPRTTQGWSSGKASVIGNGTTVALALPVIAAAAATLTVVDADRVILTAAVDAHADLKVGDILSFTSVTTNVSYSFTVRSISDDGLVVTFEELGTAASELDLNTADISTAGGGGSAFSVVTHTNTAVSYKVKACSPNLTNITIKAHGIPIYNAFPAGFFNAYVPFNYGGSNVAAPKDCGALLITFCLYPGTYQPSGHINISRAREFYIDYTTQNINDDEKGVLVIVASAINFLLISDGSAVLRYST